MCVPSMIRILHDDMKWLLSNFSVVWLFCVFVSCVSTFSEASFSKRCFDSSDFCNFFRRCFLFLLILQVRITVGWIDEFYDDCVLPNFDEREKDTPPMNVGGLMCANTRPFTTLFSFFFLPLFLYIFLTLILVPEWSCFYTLNVPTYLPTYLFSGPFRLFTSFLHIEKSIPFFFWPLFCRDMLMHKYDI